MNYLFDKVKPNYQYRKYFWETFSNAGKEVFYNEKSLIEFEYKKLNYVYLIVSGKVKQFFLDAEGNEKTILILSKGDIFGEITLFQENYDIVITQSIENTKLIKIDKDVFLNILDQNPKMYKYIIELITTKFRILMAEIYDNSYYTNRNKIINLLNRLCWQHGVQVPEGTKINIKFTHQDIANMISATRSTVTRIMADLKEEAIVKKKEGYWVVLKNYDNI